MRLTLVTTSLELGGAERTLALLASAWARRGKEVTVIVFDRSEALTYPLHPAVTLRSLGIPNQRANNVLQAVARNSRRIRCLRRAIKASRPDVVISFLDYPNIVTLLATRGLKIPVIVTEHAYPDRVPIRRIWALLRRLLYPLAWKLVCPTEQMAVLLGKRFGINGRGIPNPVEIGSATAQHKKTGSTIAAMGRLAPEKGYDFLLKAFSQVAQRHPDWSLTIIGKGPLKDELEAQAQSLGIANAVRFMGELSDPFPVLRAADFFVLSSRFEGFGNALVEAMACGLAVVSFDCPVGPSHIVRHGVDGILVPPANISALAEAMESLMNNAHERAKLAERAPEVLLRFGIEKVLGLWEELLREIVPEFNASYQMRVQYRDKAAPRQ